VTGNYFRALAAHDSSTLLPLAASVKFTENGVTHELGEGLWETAGAMVHAHSAFDTETCHSLTQAVVPDGGEDVPVALRLKLVDGQITEVESIVARPGDYTVGNQPFASDTEALAESAETVGWEEAVPEADRATREELIAWMNKYFRMFPAGVCNTVSNCVRIENGGGNFTCSAGASCAAGEPGPNDSELEPRLILADVERGLGIGFTMFQGHSDMHLFKMKAGQVYGVSAILSAADSSGWD
jgi:hypothetical protein